MKGKILVSYATCGIAAGAEETLNNIQDALGKSWEVMKTGCMGLCYAEPTVAVIKDGETRIYGYVSGKNLDRFISALKNDEDPAIETLGTPEEVYRKQVRIALRNSGWIDPENIDTYLKTHGYKALEKVLNSMTPQQVIEEIKKSGLRGRGGGGFPTGLKWEIVARQKSDVKYVICNADEGDPGAYMDRAVLEGDPHSVLEAMAIAAYAVGATQGYIYVRAEYPLAVERLDIAIEQARDRGFLGENILGTKFSFDIELRLGAGAFVCGEETALIASIEGKRGIPRPKPPYPAEKGLWGKPTLINNVETFANVPYIILHGADKFASVGTEKSRGTKVFSITGKVKKTGLFEVPMGTTIKELIYELCGGPKGEKEIKAVQTGGPSGGVIPREKFDIPIDYESLTSLGAIMGSGGMVVMDESDCMVDVAKFFLSFTQAESCGQCIPCREGTYRMLEILEKITEGKAQEKDLEVLEYLARNIKSASLCGLGKTAPNPVLSTLKWFREEYEAHLQGVCPAGVCKALITYYIDPELCRGCSLCSRVCPAQCIMGSPGKPYMINQNACIKCGSCYEVCRFGAVKRKSGDIKIAS